MPESAEHRPERRHRELILLLGTWLVLAAVTIFLARQNLSTPGLYYDEAVFAGMAKDFVTGQTHGQHMPDHETIMLGGRPFPLFVQTYLGALKGWMLIPAFKIFGSTFAVLRASNVFWQLIGLLLLMLATRRWFGIGAALIVGALLACDPTYFFISVLDWGVAVPSFVCRCGFLLFAIRWNQMRKLRDAFLVGLFAGLGFFNKADFIVFLIAISGAALICCWRKIFEAVRQHTGSVALACLGFAIGAGPMLVRIPRMIALTVSGPHPNAPGEFGIKLKTLLSMYDGSHFYRLMNAGGVFERMYGGDNTEMALHGIVVLYVFVAIGVVAYRKKIPRWRDLVFLVLTAFLITLGVFILPDAVRIHHAVLVYPFPDLISGAIVPWIWKVSFLNEKAERPTRRLSQWRDQAARGFPRALIIFIVAIVSVGQFGEIGNTQQLIQRTGGRGRWSESLNEFCRENADRSDLTIVSLDWGFNEQLMFLTDGPELAEPFWGFNQTLPPLPPNPNYIYLAHPLEYSVLKYDVAYLDQLQENRTNAEITPHFDRQNEVAFYTIRFRPQ